MYPYEPHSGTHPAPYWLRDDCHSKHYRDPYMNSFSCDDQLPLISSIGRGPKGAGITAKLLKDTDTEFIFSLVNDETGEQVFQSPNLAPAIVSVSAPKHTPIAGENYPITFSMRRGTDVSEYTVDIPSGAQGSLIYCLEDPIHLNSTTENENSGMWFKLANLGDTTFRTTIDHLLIYGEHDWTDKPIPRVNDIIFCPYYAEKQDGYSIGVSFGTIKAIENGTVVWTARTFVPSSDIGLSESGTWIINGKDSGFVAKGEKGDKGMTGPQGVKGDKGDPFTYNDFTESQIAELKRPATEAAADAKAAIAEVKATEAKLYPAAENILVGSETGAVAHVEDAFDGAALREITVEGACKQDGIPSPDAPKPIAVVENPVVKVVGRNVLDFTFPAFQAAYSNGIAKISSDLFAEKEISLPHTTPSSSSGFGFVQRLMPGSYTVKALNAPQKAAVNIAGYATFEGTTDVKNKIWSKSEQYLDVAATFTIEGEQPQWVVFCFAAKWDDGTNKITYPADFKAVVEYGGTATEYKPHTSQTLTFTLPAEHPYLAKLPDGTADEIVVDEEGDVELVARVARVLPSEQKLTFMQGDEHSASYISFNFVNDSKDQKRLMSSAYEAVESTTRSGYIYCPEKVSIVIRDNRFTSKEQARELLDGVVVYLAVEPTRYSLGKIEMPKAQDSIVNVWTDAEVTPKTGIEYTRDVNIVVANIEECINKVEQALLERATDEDIDEMFLAK